MKLDLPTLVFLMGLTTLAQVLALAVQFRSNRAYRGTGWWLAGAAAFAAGFILLLLSGGFGLWWLGMFGNPALMFAHVSFLIGTRCFLDLPARRRWPLLALAAAVATYYLFLFLLPSISARTVLVAATIALFDLVAAVALLGRQGRGYGQPARYTALVFALHSGFLLVLAGITLAHPPLRTYHDYSLFQSLAFVVPSVTSTLWTFGFILLLNQRLDAERRESLAEWRRAEQEKAGLDLRNRQLLKAESLARMAGAIAHHNNNRLQAVMSSLDLLDGTPPGPAFDRTLAQAKEATERAAEIARLMLVYLGRAPQRVDLEDLAGLCRSHLAAIEATLPERIRLQVHLPEPGPAILANSGQIQVALANLVDNAVEAMGEGGGDLRVEVGLAPAGQIPSGHRFPVGWQPQAIDHAWLEVADAGSGIAPEDMEKLCDPFYSTKFTGRGLGLPVVLGIIQAHGGGMTVTSRPGAGSTFRLHVPRANPER